MCFALFAASTFVQTAIATTSDLTGDADQLILEVQNSADDCWRNPSSSRKDTIVNKLNDLRGLIEENLFDEAYDKLLYDIKPKLTGLKTDESEEPWAEGDFKNPWVICDSLKEVFRVSSNEFLSHLQMGSAYDDDDTPPVVTIAYAGGSTDGNPGFWSILVEDLESGLDEVQILVNGIEYLYDQDLVGVQSISYQVPVPVFLDWQQVQVIAVNYDIDWESDQESSSEESWICLVDDDTTPPTISVNYYGGYDTNDPGVWLVLLNDLESGLGEVIISVDGIVVISDTFLTTSEWYSVSVPAVVGIRTIIVTVKNHDIDWDGDQETGSMMDQVFLDPPPDEPPPIIIIG